MSKSEDKPASQRTDPKTLQILELLQKTYPDAHCELNYSTPFQLLVATILSAQCTDTRVNMVTSRLFAKYPQLDSFIHLEQVVLEQEIRECGLFHTKAKNILAVCRELAGKYQGEVPKSVEELVLLPGVGKKTANAVVSNAFGIPALAVDTHVFRVSKRLGLALGENVTAVENELLEKIQRDSWISAHHLLIWHGRRMCEARNPKCANCPLVKLCEFALKNKRKKEFLSV